MTEVHGNVSLRVRNRAPLMYRNDPHQSEFADFYLPFGGKLLASNRWVKLAGLVPWSEVEECYRQSFKGTGMGAPAKSARIAFGALVIKERLGITKLENFSFAPLWHEAQVATIFAEEINDSGFSFFRILWAP